MATTRRELCRAGGAAFGAAGGGVLVLGAAGVAAAAHADAQPAHVELTFDEDYLDTYQPLLDMDPQTSQEDFLGLYGIVAESPERDTNVCVYWCKYTHQDGWLGNLDSHNGDHEPVAVEVDDTTGEVERVRASVYHWMKGEASGDAVPMENDTNPRLRVIEPWHQYTAAEPDAAVERFDVVDLLDPDGGGPGWDDWLANGLEKDVVPGAVYNPWVLRSRESWWRDRTAGLNVDRGMVKAARAAGFDQEGSLSA